MSGLFAASCGIIGAVAISTLWLNHRVEDRFAKLYRKQDHLMALVSVDQTVLDAIGGTLDEIANAVEAIVNDDSNDLDEANLSGITAPVSRLQSILAGPVDEPVVDQPNPPVVEEPPVDDGSDDDDFDEDDDSA